MVNLSFGVPLAVVSKNQLISIVSTIETHKWLTKKEEVMFICLFNTIVVQQILYKIREKYTGF